jgi:hydroxyacylglutathione hydrolase
MKQLNQAGPALLGDLLAPEHLNAHGISALLEEGALIVDTRPADAYADAHIPGTINIPFNRSFINWAGWLVSHEQPFYVIVGDEPGRPREVARALHLIGLDHVGGYFGAEAVASTHGLARPVETRQMDIPELASALARGDVTVVDVRSETEWDHGHIPGARHVPLGHLVERLPDLPTDRPIVVQCQSGGRSAIAASLLQRAGVKDVMNLHGGYAAWEDSQER